MAPLRASTVSRAWILSPIRRMLSAEGPTKTQVRFFAGLDEVRTLGKKSIAGMNINARPICAPPRKFLDVQIAVLRSGLADSISLIRIADMLGETIRVRIDRDHRKTQRAGGAGDPDRDFPAVGDKNGSARFFFIMGYCRACARDPLALALNGPETLDQDPPASARAG